MRKEVTRVKIITMGAPLVGKSCLIKRCILLSSLLGTWADTVWLGTLGDGAGVRSRRAEAQVL